MFLRYVDLNFYNDHTFFLWGPRKSGKSTLLRNHFVDAPLYIDLLFSREYQKFSTIPGLLVDTVVATGAPRSHIVIDEIQKVPTLLDDVHWLIENKGYRFCLCGSSARKLRRGHANLLGGRALRAEMFGVVAPELGDEYDLQRLLTFGYLPQHFTNSKPEELLHSYIADYLKEEIAAEGLVRNLPTFSRFLEALALSDGNAINETKVASECGVSRTTVHGYIEILLDTLLARQIPAYIKQAKRRITRSPKIYFADVGVVNSLAKRGSIAPGSNAYGAAFENYICHELSAHTSYSKQRYDISYWRLTTGIEVDFILGDMNVAIEVKSSNNIGNRHLKNLRELAKDHTPQRKILLCTETRKRLTADGIEIYPYKQFLDELWNGEILC